MAGAKKWQLPKSGSCQKVAAAKKIHCQKMAACKKNSCQISKSISCWKSTVFKICVPKISRCQNLKVPQISKWKKMTGAKKWQVPKVGRCQKITGTNNWQNLGNKFTNVCLNKHCPWTCLKTLEALRQLRDISQNSCEISPKRMKTIFVKRNRARSSVERAIVEVHGQHRKHIHTPKNGAPRTARR